MTFRVGLFIALIISVCFIFLKTDGEAHAAGMIDTAYVHKVGSTCSYLSSPLTFGSRGEKVIKLQTFLINEGMDIPAGPTGYYGAQTQAAVSDFQLKYSFQILFPLRLTYPTGAVYSATLKQINSIYCSQ